MTKLSQDRQSQVSNDRSASDFNLLEVNLEVLVYLVTASSPDRRVSKMRLSREAECSSRVYPRLPALADIWVGW